ncbi:MAG: shikimate dehydrogenase [Rhodomicrobium sp.]
MKRACVIGWPVSHSLSPVIHGYWLKENGLEGDYCREAVEPKDFERFLRCLAERGYCGANITVPHKLEAFRLCGMRDEAATAIGAVNTVWLERGLLAGSNTDAYGFATNLDEESAGWDAGGPAVVIGAGGAARAVIWALLGRGFGTVRIVNRTKAKADELARSFPPAKAVDFGSLNRAVEDARLLVNCSTLGMDRFPPLDIDLSSLGADATVCDIVYKPLETDLLRQAREKGLAAVDGLGMLLHQAVPGFEKWFGVRPKVSAELRNAVLAAQHDQQSPAS